MYVPFLIFRKLTSVFTSLIPLSVHNERQVEVIPNSFYNKFKASANLTVQMKMQCFLQKYEAEGLLEWSGLAGACKRAVVKSILHHGV